MEHDHVDALNRNPIRMENEEEFENEIWDIKALITFVKGRKVEWIGWKVDGIVNLLSKRRKLHHVTSRKSPFLQLCIQLKDIIESSKCSIFLQLGKNKIQL
jgi:hypothetical protein